MNYAEYLRKQAKSQTKIIGFNNGQDASQVTLKAQAIASSSTNFIPMATTTSQIGGSKANIVQTNVPSAATHGRYVGVADGLPNADRTAGILAAAIKCAACSDAPSSAPYNIVVPPTVKDFGLPYITPTDPLEVAKNAPGVTKCCTKDYSQLFRNNNEITKQQGLQSKLRVQYNLPNKLQGLRGPIIINQ